MVSDVRGKINSVSQDKRRKTLSQRATYSRQTKLHVRLKNGGPGNQHTRELISSRKTSLTQTQQQRPEWPTVTLTWHACKYKVHKLHHRYILKPFGGKRDLGPTHILCKGHDDPLLTMQSCDCSRGQKLLQQYWLLVWNYVRWTAY